MASEILEGSFDSDEDTDRPMRLMTKAHIAAWLAGEPEADFHGAVSRVQSGKSCRDSWFSQFCVNVGKFVLDNDDK